MAAGARIVATATLLALALPQGPAAARPDPSDRADREARYTALATIPGTSQQSQPVSATTPDGTDAVLWIAGPTGFRRLTAAVRPAGRSAWEPVPGTIHSVDMQQVAAAPVGAGDLQVAWVADDGAGREVMTARLSTATSRWSPPVQVFADPGYHHEDPSIAVRPDGTVLVLAQAVEVVPSTPHRDRAVVGVRKPGGPFVSTYLSAVDVNSAPHSVSVGPDGQTLVAFVTGTTLGNVVANAATLDTASTATWQLTALTAPGDGNVPVGAVGDGGRAAVAWYDPTDSTTLVMATGTIGAGPTTWSPHPVRSGAGIVSDIAVTVFPSGAASVVWLEYEVSKYVVKMRSLRRGTMGPVEPVSAASTSGANHSIAARPDGRALLVWRDYISGPDPGRFDGIRATLLTDGVRGATMKLADSTVAGLSYRADADAASRSMLIGQTYVSGTGSSFQWLGQANVKPAVVKDGYSGTKVKRAKVVRVSGRKLRCRTGLWVDSTTPKHRWFRDGDPIPDARKRTYRVRPRDPGHKLRCQAKGTNQLSKKSLTLKSKARRVR